VKLLLPCDFQVGDEAIEDNSIKNFYYKCDPDARDEGMDYEGDVKLVDLLQNTNSGGDEGVDLSKDVDVSSITVDGYVLDIGPNSIIATKTLMKQSELVLIWGTAGICEAGSFQEGTKQIVMSCAKTPWVPPKQPSEEEEQDGIVETLSPSKVLVLGDATSEWFLRFVDPDGSETKGDLVAAGVVNFSCRNTVSMVGAIGEYISPALEYAMRRPTAGIEEWKYDILAPVEGEEEEDDDDEDEDEDEI
tara:strand:+ start:514 stop:1254 length:741 start_codon:yes stop_codon:yes gene_type:complete